MWAGGTSHPVWGILAGAGGWHRGGHGCSRLRCGLRRRPGLRRERPDGPTTSVGHAAQAGRRGAASCAGDGRRAGRVVLPTAAKSHQERAADVGRRTADPAGRYRVAAARDRPGQRASVRAIVALASTVPLFLLLFASVYVTMAQASPANFSTHQLTRTDGLYFTVTTFATVGYRRHHPGQPVRPARGHRPDDPGPAGPGPGHPRVRRGRATRQAAGASATGPGISPGPPRQHSDGAS